MSTEYFFDREYARDEIHIESQPCLFMVDFQVGPFSHFQDDLALQAVPPCTRILNLFRQWELPLVHFWLDEAKWYQRNPRRRAVRSPFISSNEIYPGFHPLEGEMVVEKPDRSCFFETGIENFLLRNNVQHIVLMGTTTSGCIRATATHGDMLGYTMILPEQCIFDVTQEVHDNNMFDMSYKIAEVWDINRVEKEVIEWVISDPARGFRRIQ